MKPVRLPIRGTPKRGESSGRTHLFRSLTARLTKSSQPLLMNPVNIARCMNQEVIR